MSEGNYSVQTEDNQSIKNLKNVFENKERKDNNARSPKNSNNLSTKKDGNWVKKNRFSLGLSIEVDNDEGQNQPVEIVSTNVINNTEYAENNEVDIKEKIKKFQGNSRKKEEITFEELKSRKYVKTTLEFGVGGTPRESGLANNEAGVETVVPERNRRITERFEENYDDDDPSENQDDTDYEGKVKEKVEYYENIKGSGEPEYIPQFGKHEWDNQRTYGESGNEVNQPENRRTDYSSDITYETTYGKYKSPTHKEYGKTKITTPQANQLNNNRTDFSSDISYETTYGKYNESKHKESEKIRTATPQVSQLNNKRTDYAQDVSYETTYGKHKEHGHKESEKTKITTPQANQLNSKRTDFSSDVSYETTYGKYNESKHKESEKTRITTPQASQLNNKRTDYAQDVSYETTYGKHKEHVHKESKESEKTLTQQLNQEYKSSTPLESSTMQKSSSTNSSSYQPPTIKIDKANIEMTEQHTGESPGSKQMSTSIEKTPIQVNKPRDDDSYFRLDTSTNDDQFFGKSSSIVIIDNKFETSFQKEAKRKEGCCSAFCKHILKIFK